MDMNDLVRSGSSIDDNTNDFTDINLDIISDQIKSATAAPPPDKSDMMSADKPTFIKPADYTDMDLLDDVIPRIVDGLETPDSEAHTTFQEFFIESDSSEDLRRDLGKEDILNGRSFPSPAQNQEASIGTTAIQARQSENLNDCLETKSKDVSSGEREDCNFIDSSVEHILWNLLTQDAVDFEEEVCANESKDNDLEVNLNSFTTSDEPTNDKDINMSKEDVTNDDAAARSKANTKNSMKHKRNKSPVIPPHIPEIKEKFDNTCTICDKTFARKDKVMRHMLVHIPEIPEYCQLCDRLMVREDVYLLQTITIDLRFSCKKCEEFFCGSYPPLGWKMEVVHWFQESDIDSYMKTKKKVKNTCLEFATHRFSCDICEENFILEQSLAFHVRKIHTNNQESDNASKSTTVAQKSFEQNAKKSRKLSPLIESLKAGPRNGKSTRIFTCDFCHHPYRQKRTLTNHMKTCTDEKEFPCDLCDIIFARKNELSVHKKKDHRIQASQMDN